jgi:superoxide reductase
MTQLHQIYKCNICGNIVEVLHTGQGELVCCGQPMELKEPHNSDDEHNEKHVPVIEKTDSGFIVRVGSNPHPMEENHYIEWIEINIDGETHKKFLKPGDAPEFEIETQEENIKAKEYCNIHGLWSTV